RPILHERRTDSPSVQWPAAHSSHKMFRGELALLRKGVGSSSSPPPSGRVISATRNQAPLGGRTLPETCLWRVSSGRRCRGRPLVRTPRRGLGGRTSSRRQGIPC